jgi:hypothetical protein
VDIFQVYKPKTISFPHWKEGFLKVGENSSYKNGERLAMTEDSEKEFLDRLSACIEEIDLDACVSKAADLAKERGISPEKLLELSDGKYKAGQFKLEYVLALAAAQNLDEKATAYFYAGQAFHELQFLKRQKNSTEKLSIQIRILPRLTTTWAICLMNWAERRRLRSNIVGLSRPTTTMLRLAQTWAICSMN